MVRFENSAAFVGGLATLFGCPTWAAKASNTHGEHTVHPLRDV